MKHDESKNKVDTRRNGKWTLFPLSMLAILSGLLTAYKVDEASDLHGVLAGA